MRRERKELIEIQSDSRERKKKTWNVKEFFLCTREELLILDYKGTIKRCTEANDGEEKNLY